jgi:hypothetical protein
MVEITRTQKRQVQQSSGLTRTIPSLQRIPIAVLKNKTDLRETSTDSVPAVALKIIWNFSYLLSKQNQLLHFFRRNCSKPGTGTDDALENPPAIVDCL